MPPSGRRRNPEVPRHRLVSSRSPAVSGGWVAADSCAGATPHPAPASPPRGIPGPLSRPREIGAGFVNHGYLQTFRIGLPRPDNGHVHAVGFSVAIGVELGSRPKAPLGSKGSCPGKPVRSELVRSRKPGGLFPAPPPIWLEGPRSGTRRPTPKPWCRRCRNGFQSFSFQSSRA